MRGGTVWGLQKKELKPTEQPNTDVWKVEKCYKNPKTLIHNWHDTRAKAEVSAILNLEGPRVALSAALLFV